MKGLLGKKIGMSQVFVNKGNLIPVTIIKIPNNIILQKKKRKKDGYNSVQLGIINIKSRYKINKSNIGHSLKANTKPKVFIKEFKSEEMMKLNVGDVIKLDNIFKKGDFVDVVGVSRGHGTCGTIKRGNRSLGVKTHGSRFHRSVGSLATGGVKPSRIKKGALLPGRKGGKFSTIKNLQIINIDIKNKCLLVKGNIPGRRNKFIIIKLSNKIKKNKLKKKVFLDI